MEYSTLVLRIIHIFAGVLWVGAAWIGVLFLEPTIRALGPEGGKFMSTMVRERRYSTAIMIAAVLTLLAGWGLWFMRYGVPSLQTTAGLTFFIGGIIGLIAGGVGGAVGSTSSKLTALGSQIAMQNAPPTPEQLAEMRALQGRLRQFGVWAAILTTLALLSMAVARYL
jgi:hypothetical protein